MRGAGSPSPNSQVLNLWVRAGLGLHIERGPRLQAGQVQSKLAAAVLQAVLWRRQDWQHLQQRQHGALRRAGMTGFCRACGDPSVWRFVRW